MEFCHGDFKCGDPALMLFRRNSPAVVCNGYLGIFMKDDPDVFGKASDGFIHRIVNDFCDEMMEALLVRCTDKHSRPFSDRFQALEILDMFCGVRFRHFGGTSHQTKKRLALNIQFSVRLRQVRLGYGRIAASGYGKGSRDTSQRIRGLFALGASTISLASIVTD